MGQRSRLVKSANLNELLYSMYAAKEVEIKTTNVRRFWICIEKKFIMFEDCM